MLLGLLEFLGVLLLLPLGLLLLRTLGRTYKVTVTTVDRSSPFESAPTPLEFLLSTLHT